MTFRDHVEAACGIIIIFSMLYLVMLNLPG